MATFMLILGLGGSLVFLLGVLSYLVLVHMVIPYVLARYKVKRVTNGFGEELLQIPAGGRLLQPVTAHLVWSGSNRERVEALRSSWDHETAECLPRHTGRKFLCVTVYNVALSADRAAPGGEAPKQTKDKTSSRQSPTASPSGIRRLVKQFSNGLVNLAVLCAMRLLSYMDVVLNDVTVTSSDGEGATLALENVFLCGQRASIGGTALSVGASRAQINLHSQINEHGIVVRMDTGLCLKARLVPTMAMISKGKRFGFLDDVNVVTSVPVIIVQALKQQLVRVDMLSLKACPGESCMWQGVSTLSEGSEHSHGVLSSGQLFIAAESLSCGLSVIGGDDGLTLAATKLSVYAALTHSETGREQHIAAGADSLALLDKSCALDKKTFDLLCSQADETTTVADAFDLAIREKMSPVIRASDLYVAVSRGTARMDLQVQAGALLVATMPKTTASLCTALYTFVMSEISPAKAPQPEQRAKKAKPATNLTAQVMVNRGCLLLIPGEDIGLAATRGVVVLFSDTKGTKLKKRAGRKLEGQLEFHDLKNLQIMTQRTVRNVNAGTFICELTPYLDVRQMALRGYDLYAQWNPDWQDLLDTIKPMVSPLLGLKDLVRSSPGSPEVPTEAKANGAANGTAQAEDIVPVEANGHEEIAKKFSFKFDCGLFVRNFYLEVVFPDGPSAAVHVGDSDEFRIGDEYWGGRDIYWIINNKRLAYGQKFKMCNFIVSMRYKIKTVDVSLWKTRLLLPHGFHYGVRQADFLIRLRSYMKARKQMRKPDAPVRKQFPDFFIKGWDVELFMQDHPLNGFLLRRLPLWRDEALRRIERCEIFEDRISEIPRESQIYAYKRLLQSHSDSYVRRVRALQEAEEANTVPIAPLFPKIVDPPIARLEVGVFNMAMYHDEAVKARGTEEHLRRFVQMDTCKLPSRDAEKKNNDNWQELGFRSIDWSLTGVRLSLKDFPTDVVSCGMLHMKGQAGVGKQKVPEPFRAFTRVGLGSQLAVDTQMPVTSMKMFLDLTVTSNVMQVAWNHAYMPALMEMTRAFTKFIGEGKDISPRLMAFDLMRANHHARIRLTVSKLAARVGVAASPYAQIEHFIDLSAAPLTFNLSRFRDQDYPLMLSLKNFTMTPRQFNPDIASKLTLADIRVGLDMKYRCKELKRDPVDHYIQPFVKSNAEAVPNTAVFVIGPDTVPRPPDEEDHYDLDYTIWHTDLAAFEDWDTYREWRSRSIDVKLVVGVDSAPEVLSEDMKFEPDCLTTDGLTTIQRNVRLFGSIGPAVKPAPRWLDKRFKKRAPAGEALGALMRSLKMSASVNCLEFELWDNLMPGHAVRVRLGSTTYDQTSARERGIMTNPQELEHRAATVECLKIGFRVPNLDIGGKGRKSDEGFFLLATAVTFTTVPGNTDVFVAGYSRPLPAKSFASPFRGVTADDQRCKGRTIEEAESKNKVSIRSLRFFISPDRRDAIVYWQTAVREKKMPLMQYIRKSSLDSDLPEGTESSVGEEEDPALQEISAAGGQPMVLGQAEDSISVSSAGELMDFGNAMATVGENELLELWPVFHMIIDNTQVMFASPETHGTIILSSTSAEINYNYKKRMSRTSTEGYTSESEWQVTANNTQLYTVNDSLVQRHNGELWLTDDPNDYGRTSAHKFEPMTGAPLVLNIMFVANPGKTTDETARLKPSTLYINVPQFSLDTTSKQFLVFRKVIHLLNKRLPHANEVRKELAILYFNLLKSIDEIEQDELEAHGRHLKNVVEQFEYSLETFNTKDTQPMCAPEETVEEAKIRYQAKARAFNTFVHRKKQHDQMDAKTESAPDQLFPSMFFSCSFDSIVWIMREENDREPLARMTVSNPLFNRIAYIARGSSMEFTLTDINVENLMRGATYKQVLALHLESDAPAGPGLQSSDNRNVAFRWSHMISEIVGGINVYEYLTIKVAPLRTNLSTRLLKALNGFLRNEPTPTTSTKALMNPTRVFETRNLKDVEIMSNRADRSNFFRYIYIGELKLVATLRLVEEAQNKFLEYFSSVHNLVITDSSHMYSSKTWSWDDFQEEMKQVLTRLKNKAINHVIRSKLFMGSSGKGKDDDSDAGTEPEENGGADGIVDMPPDTPEPGQSLRNSAYGNILYAAEASLPSNRADVSEINFRGTMFGEGRRNDSLSLTSVNEVEHPATKPRRRLRPPLPSLPRSTKEEDHSEIREFRQ